MGNTALQQRSGSATGTVGSYNGVEMPVSYGDPAAELAALQGSCGVFDLAWRAKVSVAGKDRVRWLHNMVTNNVRDLPVNRGCYCFVLNAQGRILGDMYVFNVGESLLIDTDRTQVEGLFTAMKRFIIMDKAELVRTDETRALGICGPRAEELLNSVGIEAAGLGLLEMRSQQWEGCDVRIVRGPENKPGLYELWSSETCVGKLNEKIQGAGALPVGAQALDWWRILRGIPHYGQDIRERDLPQETGQMQALNFNKGCYIGQEIVERIRSRGQVHRTFTGFEFAAAAPAPGKFEANGRAFAELTSVARIPAADGERVLGLGYVREETRAAGPAVDLNGCQAAIADLPFAI